MVTLPEISTYSKKDIESFLSYSQISAHYLKLIEKQASSVSEALRIKKHQHWLRCALATFHNNHHPEQVCRYWSHISETILQQAWEDCQIPTQWVSLLGFGKLGSYELNLSSDIDVVFVKDNSYEDDQLQSRIKKFLRLVGESTPFGFAYRVDLNLRPGGDQSPLVPSKAHFYNYYDEYLEAWNRLSFVRVRPLFEESKLDQDLMSYCQARAFPRRLDFSVIDGIKNIRSKLEFQWRKSNEPLDIKFHPGGIRDIELYIQSLQVIYGGRNPSIRTASFSDAISHLIQAQALPKDDGDFLLSFYWKLRKFENLIHIKDDAHTYLANPQAFTHFEFSEKDLISELHHSESLLNSFFSNQPTAPTTTNTSTSDLSEQSLKAIEDIRNLKSLSIKKQKVTKLKEEIVDNYIQMAQDIAIDSDLSIQIFRDFIFSIKSKTSIFHLLSRHPDLLNHLAWLFSISPYAGQILCRRPELIDSFVLSRVEINDKDDMESLWENLIDYKLLGQMTSIVYLFKHRKASHFFNQLSNQADFIVEKLLEHLCREFEAEELEILTLGKWSGQELGLQSDLDFIFLSNKTPTTEQIKVARRLITILSSRSNAGRLYNIDMRLKPNDQAGPLIVEKSKFLDFIRTQAEPWQKQAYLRSRQLGTSEFYFKDHFDLIQTSDADERELIEILKKLIVPTQSDQMDLKYCPGGLVDTEFTIQRKILLQSNPPQHPSTHGLAQSLGNDPELIQKLLDNYDFLRCLEQALQICNDSPSTKISRKSSVLPRLTKMMNTQDIYNQLIAITSEQQALLKDLT